MIVKAVKLVCLLKEDNVTVINPTEPENSSILSKQIKKKKQKNSRITIKCHSGTVMILVFFFFQISFLKGVAKE